jgi:hypothetical protein
MKAWAINLWRRHFPHPSAIARREEARRAREARARRDAVAWKRAVEVGAMLKREAR